MSFDPSYGYPVCTTRVVGYGYPVVTSFCRRGDDFGNKWQPRLHQGGHPVVTSDSVFSGEERGTPLSLLGERRAIPSQEISRRCFAEIPLLRQSPMRCLAVTVNAVMSR